MPKEQETVLLSHWIQPQHDPLVTLGIDTNQPQIALFLLPGQSTLTRLLETQLIARRYLTMGGYAESECSALFFL
jgi:hypothetical protein